MRAEIMFDTLDFMDALRQSGMDDTQAEALTKATAKAFGQMMDTKELATKKDIRDLKTEMQSFIVRATTSSIALICGAQAIINYIK